MPFLRSPLRTFIDYLPLKVVKQITDRQENTPT